MKLLIMSDIHGIKTNLDLIENVMYKENIDKLVVLGDLYYIGPRNKFIDGYDINYVKDFLTRHREHLICLRGNCDSDVDVMVSDFPISETINNIFIDNLNIYFTHGHIYNRYKKDKLPSNSILIQGHEHIAYSEEIDNILFLNPGSISLPKDSNKPSYLIYENNVFTCYDIDGKILYETKKD